MDKPAEDAPQDDTVGGIKLLRNGALVDIHGRMIARLIYCDEELAEALRAETERVYRERATEDGK